MVPPMVQPSSNTPKAKEFSHKTSSPALLQTSDQVHKPNIVSAQTQPSLQSRPQTSPSPFRPIQSPAGPNTYANISHSSPVKPAPTANLNYKSSLEHSNSTGKFTLGNLPLVCCIHFGPIGNLPSQKFWNEDSSDYCPFGILPL